MQVIRDGGLHVEANSRGSLVEAAADFYVGTMATFYRRWRDGGKTMKESGFVLKEVEAAAKKKPKVMVAAAAQPL